MNGDSSTTPTTVSAAQRSAPQRRRGWLAWGFWLLLCGGLAGAVWRDPTLIDKARSLVEPKAAPPKAPPPRIVPVTAVESRQGDMELFLNGLGSVAAFNSVTVRSRVEGELTKVAFTEGQVVAAGDLLAEVDPRFYEVQLRQAEAQLARARARLDRLAAAADATDLTPVLQASLGAPAPADRTALEAALADAIDLDRRSKSGLAGELPRTLEAFASDFSSRCAARR
jgi:multidrug efflux system membrane fusion protein